jgi:hypothetical protein
MSMMRPIIDGFVGYGDGREIQLRTDELYPEDSQVVRARRELFVFADEADEPLPTRPATKSTKPPAGGRK